MLFPQQIDVFRRAFGIPILNCYGGRELGVMACQQRTGGPIQVLRPWLFLEVVDSKGRPVAPGESGRLLWTSTTCRGTPFLRYDIEDMGTFESSQCNESGVTALHELDGRSAGLLELPNGRRFNALFWNHLFKEYMEIRQFQVVLQGPEIELRFRGQGFAQDREADLRRRLDGFLGPMNVRINWMEKIPLTAQGKLVQVVRPAV